MTALTVEERDGDIAAATQEAYERLLAAVRPSSHPYLIRIWNYFDRINEGEGDQERYRQFCVGRAKAVDGMFNDPPPAATAIGGDGIKGRIKIVALCAAKPAIALENPRQTPAWQYPKDFGPVAPGFSRGAIINHDLAIARLLASGTASITGHESQHTGDSKAQITEALSNLRALLEVGTQRSGRQFTLAGCDILRVYLRNPKDLAFAQEALAATDVPASHVIFLRGDICRRELDVEIEGVFAAR